MTSFLLIATLLAIWPFGSGKEFRMTAGSGVPAATGTVKVTREKDNGNTAFKIKVEHLAKPANLSPPASTYLVWVTPRNGMPTKVGAIGVDSDLKGEFSSVTVSKDFDLFITAEESEFTTTPSGPQVLQVHVDVS